MLDGCYSGNFDTFVSPYSLTSVIMLDDVGRTTEVRYLGKKVKEEGVNLPVIVYF